MVEQSPNHPRLVYNLSSQYSISNDLFCVMLETATSRAELGRSWTVISHDIDLEERQDLIRQQERHRN